MKIKLFLISITVVLTALNYSLKADEGMWLLNLIDKNYSDMKKQGFKLSSKDIYDVNNKSLKDAVIWFNGYCTGSIISDKGLILTNHHCGYEFISKLSTIDNNILKNGWYSKSIDQDKPVKNLWIGILKEIKDVTPIINKYLKNTGEKKYEQELAKAKLQIIKQAESQNENYQAYVKDIFGNNQYILVVIERFNDIRLVGTPPESLGKFGGNKDNWTWPRHTDDFSLFRIYANANNEACNYSKSNVPYRPKKFIKTSLDGYKRNDFSLIMGYPGSTNRYSTSFEIEFKNKTIYSAISTIRQIPMKAWENEMSKSDSAKLQLSNIYQVIANYEKYYRGMSQGIKKFEIINNFKEREENFIKKISNVSQVDDYKVNFENWQKLYNEYADVITWKTYSEEILSASPILRIATKFIPIGRIYKEKDYALANIMINSMSTDELFAEFNYEADKEMLPYLMLEFWKNTTYEHLPKVLDNITEEYGDDALEAFQNYTQEAFFNSIFASKKRYLKFLRSSNTAKERILLNDSIYKLVESLLEQYDYDIGPKYEYFLTMQKKYRTKYILGLQLLNPNKLFYPDANLTPRITYGKIHEYVPTDGIKYNYFTTSEGLIEKNLLGDQDYKLSKPIIGELKKANSSKYIDSDGKLHVCFITDNDIIGGNSGSPILNKNLELIGIAFDGNWESIPGQIYFNKKYNRAIGVDIRFILWSIDNLAGVKYLADEIIHSKS